MPLFRALAKNMAASYFGKKAPYGFVMEVILLYVFILWLYCVNQAYNSPTTTLASCVFDLHMQHNQVTIRVVSRLHATVLGKSYESVNRHCSFRLCWTMTGLQYYLL